MGNKRMIINWILLIAWMLLIFLMSNQPAHISNQQSNSFINMLAFFGIDLNSKLGSLASFVVRKTAHFTEYAVLGFFAYKAVSCDVKDRKKAVLMAQLISTGYASTDEIHQMFVPGREGKVFDVMIDSCGAFCGIMVSCITQKFIEKKKGNQI